MGVNFNSGFNKYPILKSGSGGTTRTICSTVDGTRTLHWPATIEAQVAQEGEPKNSVDNAKVNEKNEAEKRATVNEKLQELSIEDVRTFKGIKINFRKA